MKSLMLLTFVLFGIILVVSGDEIFTKKKVDGIMSRIDEDTNLSTTQLINKYGYVGENHNVVTEDGYILEIHRIAGSNASPKNEKKPVAFLMHGLLSSSADWIIMGPEKSLGYILADAGYDVWMGNARGNTYSKNHTKHPDTSDKNFWYFSWHEIGYYDLPATIDYILGVTEQKNLLYFGHSQGTTSFWVMASSRPEYNDKIKAMYALAPVAHMTGIKSPFVKFMAYSYYPIEFLLNIFGVYEFLPSHKLITMIGDTFCNDDALTQVLCTNVIFLITGFNKKQLNTTMLPVIFGHTPAGASTRQLLHYGQGLQSEKFRWYDYGRIKNLIKYRSLTPPIYDVSKITAPVHLIYSENDWLAAVEDVKKLHETLANPAELTLVEDPSWNHLDFIWGIDANKLIYRRIISSVKRNYK